MASCLPLLLQYPLLSLLLSRAHLRPGVLPFVLSSSNSLNTCWVLAPDFRSLPLLSVDHKSVLKQNPHIYSRRAQNFRKLGLESAVVQNRGRRNSQDRLAGLGLTPRLPRIGIPFLLRIAVAIAVNTNILSSPSATLPAMLAAAHSAAAQSLNAGKMQDSSWADVSNLKSP